MTPLTPLEKRFRRDYTKISKSFLGNKYTAWLRGVNGEYFAVKTWNLAQRIRDLLFKTNLPVPWWGS